MSGRYQVYTCTVSIVSTDGAVPAGALLRWRLISENGRALALGRTTYPTLEAAVAEAREAREHAVDGTVLFSTPDRTGWGWYLVGEQDPAGPVLALSARRYARRVECLEAVGRFRQLAVAAELPSRVTVFRRSTPDTAVGA